MKISIALCTYNGEKYLPAQLDSIACQTLLPDELVVCDDCSKDSTIKILQEFKDEVSFPVHIHQNSENLGSTKNFEKAIKLCRGDVIALCDQDDVWKSHKLKRLMDALHENPEAGYAFSDAELVDEQLNPLGSHLWEATGFQAKIKRLFYQGEQFRCFIRKPLVTGATMAFHAYVGRLAMPFPTRGFWIHDGWIALIGSAIGAYGIPVDETLIAYRQHTSQQLGAPEPAETKSNTLLSKYRELKTGAELLFTAWENHCIRIIEIKEALQKLADSHPTPVLKHNIILLKEFETHFLNRRKILTSRNFGRYGLIFKETFSGRYARFSDSWRSIFRDIFL